MGGGSPLWPLLPSPQALLRLLLPSLQALLAEPGINTVPQSLPQVSLAERDINTVSQSLPLVSLAEQDINTDLACPAKYPCLYLWGPKTPPPRQRPVLFDGTLRRWHIRKQGTAIRWIYHCNPFAGEKYYLRLLLTVVRRPQSFEHLCTVDGLIHSTFQAACLARGLLQNDNEWILCFTEAVQFSSGHSLRALFVMALVHGDITNPQQIWNQFREQFCNDLLHRLRQQSILPSQVVDPHLDYGLYLIQDVLADYGKTLADYGKTLAGYGKTLADYQLPSFVHNWACSAGNPLIAAELEYNQPQEAALAAERCLQLNTGQKWCFDIITTAIADGPQHAHFFIQGSAGTGKTFLYWTLCNHYRALGKIVICVASSGIAALLLPGGWTSHSRFHILLDVHELSSCSITKNSQLADLLRSTALIIWDEVPMQNKYCFETVHRTLQDLLSADECVFGSIPTVLGGDFAQILPVVRRGNRAAIVQVCLQRSFLWPQLCQLHLERNMRLQTDAVNQNYTEWLAHLSYDPNLWGRIALPPYMTQLHDVTEFKEQVFPSLQLQLAHSDLAFFHDRAILTFRNDMVNDFNTDILHTMPGQEHVFDSVDSADVNDAE